jgi:hypothetical protein
MGQGDQNIQNTIMCSVLAQYIPFFSEKKLSYSKRGHSGLLFGVNQAEGMFLDTIKFS